MSTAARPGPAEPACSTASVAEADESVMASNLVRRPLAARPSLGATTERNRCKSTIAPGPTWQAARVNQPSLSATLRRIERAAGALATQSVARMDETLQWFRELPAERRSWVMLVAQSGVASFVAWGRGPAKPPGVGDEGFAAGPPGLGPSSSLQQTVALIKVTIDVVEEQVPRLAAPGEEVALREAVLRFSREVAFASARVYARAAESRGNWDARLQAMLVDALLRGEVGDAMASRAAALGWSDATPVAVAVGPSPGGDSSVLLHGLHRAARRIEVEVLGGVHGDRLIAVLGGAADPLAATGQLL